MLILSRAEVRALVPMADAVALMKTAFIELSAGRAKSPVRLHVGAENDGAMMLMPAYVPAAKALGFKIVSFFGKNGEQGLPAIHALVALIDEQNGVPLALMEGGYVTALRTGAVSGAATDLLARAESRTLVVIGAGVQGVTQAAAVCAVRPITRIIAVDVDPKRLETYQATIAAEWPDLAERLEVSTDAGVVREADVICTATTARAPVFADADVRPGTHINAVGAFTPEMQEIPPETVRRATIVVDAVDAVLAEAGDLLKPLHDGLIDASQFSTELGQVAAGSAPGRPDARAITLFKSVGNAVQDVVVARFAFDAAVERGMGTEVTL